jgi:hypothetical protein
LGQSIAYAVEQRTRSLRGRARRYRSRHRVRIGLRARALESRFASVDVPTRRPAQPRSSGVGADTEQHAHEQHTQQHRSHHLDGPLGPAGASHTLKTAITVTSSPSVSIRSATPTASGTQGFGAIGTPTVRDATHSAITPVVNRQPSNKTAGDGRRNSSSAHAIWMVASSANVAVYSGNSAK